MDSLIDDLWPLIIYELTDGMFPLLGRKEYPMKEEWAGMVLLSSRYSNYIRQTFAGHIADPGDVSLIKRSYWSNEATRDAVGVPHYDRLATAHKQRAQWLLSLAQSARWLHRLLMPFFRYVYATMAHLFSLSNEHYDYYRNAYSLPVDSLQATIRPEWYFWAVYGLVFDERGRYEKLVRYIKVNCAGKFAARSNKTYIYVDPETGQQALKQGSWVPSHCRILYQEQKRGRRWQWTDSPEKALAASAEHEAVTKRSKLFLRMMALYSTDPKPAKKKRRKE